MKPSDTRRRAAPLADADKERIEALVAQPKPPPKWVGGELFAMPSRAWYEWHWARGVDPDARREPLPLGLRHAVIERDGYICQLCGGDIEPTDLHIDHIMPWSKGGKHALDNLQATHSRCNLRKGATHAANQDH